MAPKIRDLTGHKQGRLTVLYLSRREREPRIKSWFSYWMCQCTCGNTLEIEAGRLQRTKLDIMSCGCIVKEMYLTPEWKRKNTKPGAAFRMVLRQYKQNAKIRNIPWSLSEEEFKALTSSPCYYTNLPPTTIKRIKSGEQYVYNGVDRVDNTKGYSKENCVPCHSEINLMKLDMTKERFLDLCSMVTERAKDVIANN